MSGLAQQCLFGYITDPDAMEALAREGLPLEAVPSEAARPVVEYAMRHYRLTRRPPTIEQLKIEFGYMLSDADIDLDYDPDESIEWVIDALKGARVRAFSSDWSRRLTIGLGDNESHSEQKVEVASDLVSEFQKFLLDMQPHTTHVDLRDAGDRMIEEYLARQATQGQIIGMTLGLPEIDAHFGGIRPGELAILAAYAKMGKSFFVDHAAFKDWEAGKCVVLHTLENSIDTTVGRIGCFALKYDLALFDAGALPDSDMKAIEEWVNDVLKKADNPLHIFQPDPKMRTAEALVATAKAFDAESLVIDQLTFVDCVGKHRTRTEEVREVLHDIKTMISTGRNPIPCLMAHQINREGKKYSDATGFLSMEFMAESSEVERTADMAFGLYRSKDDAVAERMKFQTLAARRVPDRNWYLDWKIDVGNILVRQQIAADLSTVIPDGQPPTERAA